MRLEPIGDINFGIYKKTINKPYGHVDIGEYRNHIIEIYTAQKSNGDLIHKLYYIKNQAGDWIKSKLKYFENNKCRRVVRSQKIETTYVGDKDA